MHETLLSELTTPEGREAVAVAVKALLQRWGLDKATAAALLGLSDAARLDSTADLAGNDRVLERAGHLLAIARYLDHLLADAPQVRDRWVATPNPFLEDSSPLDLMLAQGIDGILIVRELLEPQIQLPRDL